MGWIIGIGVVIVLFIILGSQGQKNIDKRTAFLKNMGIDPNELVKVGAYVGGHPDIDNHYSSCVIYLKDNNLKICHENEIAIPRFLADIDKDKIIYISIEDSSSIEKKVTLGRVLLVGIFALAWKKKKKNEMAFLAIDWNDGKFEHSTLFSFEGKDAMQTANTARNKLIRLVK
jgi:hypothetical protein